MLEAPAGIVKRADAKKASGEQSGKECWPTELMELVLVDAVGSRRLGVDMNVVCCRGRHCTH